jgi:hypothetical protein
MSAKLALRDGLRILARQAPSAAVPEDFFELAHARQRQRRAVVATALAVTALVLGGGVLLRPAAFTSVRPAAEAPALPGLPRRLHVPPIWTASVTASPAGPAAVIFGGRATHTNLDEGRFALVAAGSDQYRTFNEFSPGIPGSRALLSPDGSLIARDRSVRSLRPGGPAPVVTPGDILAFSPDGTLIVYQTYNGIGSLNGQRWVETRIGVFDLSRRVTIATIDNSHAGEDLLIAGFAAAISGDNARLAIHVRDELRLYRLDRADPSPYATTRLDKEMLAGPGSWLPDSGSLVTARLTADGTWQLVTHNGESAQPEGDRRLPTLTGTQYVRVIGWRADLSAVVIVGLRAAGQPADAVLSQGNYTVWVSAAPARLVSLSSASTTPQILLETPPGITDLDVAAEVAIAGRLRNLDDPEYGLALFAKIALSVLAVVTGLAVLGVLRLARRRKHRLT